MPRTGRRTKLTPERQQRIVNAIAAGNYFDVSCRYTGIDEAPAYLWMQRGRREQQGIYFDFLNAVKEAEAQAEVSAVVAIKQAFGTNWAAAMTWLERKFPDRWGRKDRLDVKVLDHELERARELFGLSDEEAERLKTLAVAEAEAVVKGRRADHP